MKRKLLPIVLMAALVGLNACAKQSATVPPETTAVTPSVSEAETAEELTTEEITEPPTNAPLPDADPNACTFDEIGADVAVPVVDDSDCADGTLTIAQIDGNNMLRFTDQTTTADNLEKSVQKIRFDVSRLLSPEQLGLVDRIEFDLYAEAKADAFVNEDGEHVRAPGWIGGGGGTECADGKWYGFADYSGSGLQEYVLERSDACHVSFRFMLAASGKKWDETMTQPYLQIMRWGMGNISDLYLDNLTFFDAEGNSIPLTVSDGWAEYPTNDAEPSADTAETETDTVIEEAAE